nr:DUF512 domain-containing protein [Sporanaerobium hydrogeniformans]
MNYKEHKIMAVEPESIAEEVGIEAGDTLLGINEENIQDVFDYRYLIADEEITLAIRKANGEEWAIEIEKEYGEDLGLVFENSLMDELIRCRNKCLFCFIDQLPPNMRETVYFKDDDWRMSFLNGNYITLTNMAETDMDRLIKYHLSPINISIHATSKEIREHMLTNRFAGDIISQIKRLVEAGIEINGQIVLCKGINDGEVLDQTIRDLSAFIPHILSLTVVPVGISKFREGLASLKGFDKESSREVIDIIHSWQNYYLEKMKTRFVFAADEFYIKGEVPLPTYEEYEDFPVLDNGVGMATKFRHELLEALEQKDWSKVSQKPFKASIVTGCLTEDFMKECVQLLKEKCPSLTLEVYPVSNHFFGEEITVTGLLTGQDILRTLRQKENLGQVVLLAENMLKCGENILLDDYSIERLQEELRLPIVIVPNQGSLWLDQIIELKEKQI